MTEWFEAYSLDGVYRQNLDNDLLFLSPEEVKESLNRCRKKGQEFAICKKSRNAIFDEAGRIVRIESITETVEYYTVL